MGIFESDEEELARRIKNIENMDKPIKFHQWFIPFCIFVLGPIVGTIAIVIYEYSIKGSEVLVQFAEVLGVVGLVCFGFYLLRRLGIFPICSW